MILSHGPHRAPGVYVRQQSYKLIPPVAADEISAAEPFLEDGRHILKHLVSARVAVRIVEQLEVVQIHHDYGEAPARSLAPRYFRLQHGVDAAMVQETSDRIPFGEEPRVVVEAGILQGDAQVGGDSLGNSGIHRRHMGTVPLGRQAQHAQCLVSRYDRHRQGLGKDVLT